MKDIINDYKSYLKTKKLKIVELDYISDFDDLNSKYERQINSDDDYSSNFNSKSSEESQNDNVDSIINNNSNSDNDDKDNDSDNNRSNQKNANKNNKNKQKYKRHKSKIYILTFESIRNNLMTDKINNIFYNSGYSFNNNKNILGFKRKDIDSQVECIFNNRMKSFELLDYDSFDNNAYFIEQKLNLRKKNELIYK